MNELAKLIQGYGWWVALAVMVLMNAKSIGVALQDVLKWLVPNYKARMEAEAQEHAQAWELKRGDVNELRAQRQNVIDTMKEAMCAYREELEQSRQERQAAHEQVVELTRSYERTTAMVVEVLRDQSMVLRAQTERLERLTVCVDDIGARMGVRVAGGE